MPDIAKEQADLEKAERDIRDGERRVAQQRQLIAALRRDGHNTAEAEQLLWSLQQSLTAWSEHRELIRRLLAESMKRAAARGGGR